MTIQEMLQEIEQHKLEDLLNGYTDQDFYDDCYTLPEVDYTTCLLYTSDAADE